LHAGKTPFGYIPLGDELGHTRDTHMTEEILGATFEHEALRDEAIRAIVKQLQQHQAIQKIIKPIVMIEDFKSAFSCVPEKTLSSSRGRGYHQHKACLEGESYGFADAQAGIHEALVSIPLLTRYCLEIWKHVIDVMLEKFPGVVPSNALRIIQLLKEDFNQVLRIAFTRNITNLDLWQNQRILIA
jgi:hypothetical protein